MPSFSTLAQFIQAAASGSRDSRVHLFAAVFNIVRATMTLLVGHYKAHPRALTPVIAARLSYCASRLKAIFYTLRQAPERFLTPAQLRALTRARAVLAHVLHQPIDFSPLASLLAPLAACPPSLPRASAGTPPDSARSAARRASPAVGGPSPAISDAASDASSSALRSASPADPLLLRNPGCALAGVLLQLAAIYRVPPSPPLAPAAAPASPIPAASPQSGGQPITPDSHSGEQAQPAFEASIPNSNDPQSPLHPPP